MAHFELYGTYPAPLNGPPFGRTGNDSENVNTEGYNTGGTVPEPPNGSSESLYRSDH